MDEKLSKLLSLTSIPAIITVFYMELKTIEEQIQQTQNLRDSVIELKETMETHCHILGRDDIVKAK